MKNEKPPSLSASDVWFEGADFQINKDVAAQATVLENEVNVVVLPPNDEAFLLSLKAKAVAEFAQKGLKAVEQGGFAAGLQIFRSFSQPGELKNRGVPD